MSIQRRDHSMSEAVKILSDRGVMSAPVLDEINRCLGLIGFEDLLEFVFNNMRVPSIQNTMLSRYVCVFISIVCAMWISVLLQGYTVISSKFRDELVRMFAETKLWQVIGMQGIVLTSLKISYMSL